MKSFPPFSIKTLILVASTVLSAVASVAQQPNVVFVITDDQGYGDLACHGNPVIKTPHLDKLAEESVRFDDYHVAPTCSPTRAALLTGHWTNRTGVWHTVNGRSMLRENEMTLGHLLQEAGYATGMFGKWHLGDNYPYRPEDRGFSEVYRHGGGGVGQTPDIWNNAYFDGAYFHNGTMEAAKGFCTDVFFEKASDFIQASHKAGKPFLAYIATNAPHGPLHAPQKYLDLYPDQKANIASFFGMITNIDDNVGRLRALLEDLGIADNTLFIFTTDNGTATGRSIFNAGMRGGKGSEYEGGHRVPLFLHWPAKKLNTEKRISTLCHAVDIVPTLLDMVSAEPTTKVPFDGQSLKRIIFGNGNTNWKDRFLVTDSQRVRDPIKWRKSSVMSQEWRLINGTELYHMPSDPGQNHDVASQHPMRVKNMRAFYQAWWNELEPTFSQTTEIYLGHSAANQVLLTGHDWIQETLPPWNQAHIRNAHHDVPKNAKKRDSFNTAKHQGHWAVKVIEPGHYRIEVLRWPPEATHPIRSSLPPGTNVPGSSKAFRTNPGRSIPAAKATLRLNGQNLATKPVAETDTAVVFEETLPVGSHKLSPVFHVNGGEIGAYYTIVTKL